MAMNSQLPSFRLRLSQICHFRPFLYAIFADTRHKIFVQSLGVPQSGNVLMGQQSRGAGASSAIENNPAFDEKLYDPHFLQSGSKSKTKPVGSDLIKQWDCFSTDLSTSLHHMMSSLNAPNSKAYGHRHSRRSADSNSVLTDKCMRRLDIQEASRVACYGSGQPIDGVSVTKAVKHAVAEQKDMMNHNITATTFNKEKGTSSEDDKNKPTHEQLELVKNFYLDHLPQCHKKALLDDFHAKLHHKNIVFENRFFEKPKITVGIEKYTAELLKLRLLLAVKYVSFNFTPKTATVYTAEGCVRIHWILNTLTFSDVMRSLMKLEFRPEERLKYSKEFEAISTLFLDKDGKIIKHHIDRRTPIGWKEPSTAEKLAAKLLQPNKSLAATQRANFKRPC